MTDRPPPSLGTYRPRSGRPGSDEAAELPVSGGGGLPRIVTSRTLSHDGHGHRPTRTKPPRLPPPEFEPEFEPERSFGWRFLIASLAGLAALVAAALVAAMVLVPTDLIGDQLRAEIKARTGYDLVIGGRSSLSLWPKPIVTVREVSLSEPSRSGGRPLVSVAEIEVAVQILPLLLHDITVDHLVLRRPVFDLAVDANGRRNWDLTGNDAGRRDRAATTTETRELPKELKDFVRGASDETVRTSGVKPGTKSSSALQLSDLTLGNVGIIDGTLHYRDARTGLDEQFTTIVAQLSLPNLARPLDAVADFTWRGEPVHMTSQVSPVRALIEGRTVQARLTSRAEALSWTFDGNLTPADPFDLDGHVTATAAAMDRVARWSGRASLASFPGALDLDARIKHSASETVLDEARLAFGGTRSHGSLSLDVGGTRPVLKAALHVDKLDFNNLRALLETATTGAARPAATAPAKAPTSIEDLLRPPPAETTGSADILPPSGAPRSAGNDWSDTPIDLAPLRRADADVRVGFDHAIWNDATTGPGQVTLFLKSSLARLTLDDVQLYDGRLHGFVTLDASGAEAAIGANMAADGVSARPFLSAIGGFDWLSGRAHTALAIAGRGSSERQIVGTLTGKADLAVASGALEGLNISSVLKNLAQGKLGGLDRSPDQKTEFSTFSGSVQIANGIARNGDLRIVSPDLSATGAGTIDLPQRTMDYLLKPKLAAAGGLEIPLQISGSIDKPDVAPQLNGLAANAGKAMQAVEAIAKTPAGKEIGDTVKGLINGDPAARAKARGFLDQLLKP